MATCCGRRHHWEALYAQCTWWACGFFCVQNHNTSGFLKKRITKLLDNWHKCSYIFVEGRLYAISLVVMQPLGQQHPCLQSIGIVHQPNSSPPLDACIILLMCLVRAMEQNIRLVSLHCEHTSSEFFQHFWVCPMMALHVMQVDWDPSLIVCVVKSKEPREKLPESI